MSVSMLKTYQVALSIHDVKDYEAFFAADQRDIAIGMITS